MFTPKQYFEIASGKRQDILAACMRGASGIAEPIYGLAVGWRNRRFDRGKRTVFRADVPVISVGNLTVGGTGKTPLVAWIARWLADRSIPAAILSRGYGGKRGRKNDEAEELASQIPHVPHLQNPDRVSSAAKAVEQFGCQVLILDDGFQHRRLHRDLNIVLLDALDPFGCNHLLPRGLLRESPLALARADFIILSRADAVSEKRRREISRQVEKLAPQAGWAEITHRPTRLVNSGGDSMPLEKLQGKRVLAFCGIGNPRGFSHTLQTSGFEVAALREFPDHHLYQPEELSALARQAEAKGTAALLCTRKDLVKIPHLSLGSLPLWAVEITAGFQTGECDLAAQLQLLLPAANQAA